MKWRAPAASWRPVLDLRLFCLLAVCAVCPASAQTRLPFDEVQIEVADHWPDSLTRGWAPVQMQFQRDLRAGAYPLDIELRTRNRAPWLRVALDASVTVTPGTMERLEVYVPCDLPGHPGWVNDIDISFSGKGVRTSASVSFSQTMRSPQGRVIAVLTRGELTEAVISDFKRSLPADPSYALRGLDPNLDVSGPFAASEWGRHGPVVFRGAVSHSGSTTSAELFTVPLRELPRRPLAWTSVDTIVVLTGSELRDVPGWRPIFSWVKRGGQLAFVGPDAAARASELDGYDDLVFEDRRLTHLDAPGRAVYRSGFGTVATLEDVEISETHPKAKTTTEGWAAALGALDAGTPGDGPSALGDFYLDSERAWPDPLAESDLPVRPVLAFLILFALLVGPGSVMFSRRWKRPDVLFLLVPAFSLGATMLIAGFGIAREGFGVHGNAHSLSLLDQVNDRAVTMLRREVFVGRSGFSLRPEPTSFVLVPSRNEAGLVRTIEDDGAQLDLGGGFLPVRANTTHLVVSDTSSRARLDVQINSSGDVEVTNALGVDVERLEVLSPSGDLYRTSNALGVGDTATLEPARGTGDDSFGLPPTDPIFKFAETPRGGYRAVVAESPTADECELPMDEDYGVHVVVGNLDNASVGWR